MFSPTSSKIMGIPSVSGYWKWEIVILVSPSCAWRNTIAKKAYRENKPIITINRNTGETKITDIESAKDWELLTDEYKWINLYRIGDYLSTSG